MPHMVKITPGSNNSEWPLFQSKGIVGLFSSSREVVDSFKGLPIGTIVIASNTIDKSIGIGRITGEYNRLDAKNRLEGMPQYEHIRSAEWFHSGVVNFAPGFTIGGGYYVNISEADKTTIIQLYLANGVDAENWKTQNDAEPTILEELVKFTNNIILYPV